MNTSDVPEIEEPDFEKKNFDINDLQDEIRVDALCKRLLKLFHRHLVKEESVPHPEAGTLAHGADYFLREFVIPDRRENIFELAPERVRQFAGNWYIVKTLEPNMTELARILTGVREFYRFCAEKGRIRLETAEKIGAECMAGDFYRHRIESFWNIEGDGYRIWERECSLQN